MLVKKKLKRYIKTISPDGKSVKVNIKVLQATNVRAVEGEPEGTIECIVSVFNNVDSYGDIVLPGAFADSVIRFNVDGRYPKGVWGHDWNLPIAKTLEMRETTEGLYIKAKLILGVEKAREAYELIKEGVITDFSFGFEIDDFSFDSANGTRLLKKVTIWEWSPVLVGANPESRLVGIKTGENSGVSEEEEEIEVEVEDQPAPVVPPEEVAPADKTQLEVHEEIDEITVEAPAGEPKAMSFKMKDGSIKTFSLKAGALKLLTDMEAELKDLREFKAGRVLSTKNETKIKNAITALDAMQASATELKQMLEEVLTSVEPANDDEKSAPQPKLPVEKRQTINGQEVKVLLRDARAVAGNAQSVVARLKTLI